MGCVVRLVHCLIQLATVAGRRGVAWPTVGGFAPSPTTLARSLPWAPIRTAGAFIGWVQRTGELSSAQTAGAAAAPKRQRKQLRTIADDDEDDEEEDVAPAVVSSVPKSATRIIDDDDDE